MSDISPKFEHLFKIISSPGFLAKQSLGGEIPFFISTYDAKDEIKISEAIRLLKNKLDNQGVTVLELNLYDLTLEIIEKEVGIEDFLEMEKTMDKDEFKDALQSILEIKEVLMPLIGEKINTAAAKVNFLTGIGSVYPYIRSHNILNNLQNIAKDAPTVAFFPGDYDGHSLNLFGLLKDDNYYRAFNIESIKA